jgi:alanine racemase
MVIATESILSIDLDALCENYHKLKARSKSGACAAVVKADGYGLGAEKICLALYKKSCRNFFVAHLEEALVLRKILPDSAEIYVFHGVQQNQAEVFSRNNLIPVLNHPGQVSLWQEQAKRLNQRLSAILHVDTGMERLGFSKREIFSLHENKNQADAISWKYLMSHLACAEQEDNPMNQLQLQRFQQISALFPELKTSFANSYGLFLNADFHGDLPRPGMALYGLNPSSAPQSPMKNIVQLNSYILQLRLIDSISGVGYGASAVLPSGSRIAVVPVGYADGYLRAASNRAWVSIAKKFAPVVGRVSMDLLLVDVSSFPENQLKLGDTVNLIGENISVDQIAEWSGTIGYEVLTRMGGRYTRRYLSSEGLSA